jgi:hypothetical protein
MRRADIARLDRDPLGDFRRANARRGSLLSSTPSVPGVLDDVPGICARDGCGAITSPRFAYCREHTHRSPSSQQTSTAEWKKLTEVVMARCGGVCELCMAAPAIHVHHMDGVNADGTLPKLDRVRALCRQCHTEVGREPAILR